jgi:hypothetical protein
MTKSKYPQILVLVAVMLAALATPIFARSDSKAERELEIMTGILETTLGFLDQPSSGRVLRSFGGEEVEGYLLPGQGVVFLVSMQHNLTWSTGFLEAAELAEADFPSDRAPRAGEDRLQALKATLQREQEATKERLEEQHEQFQEAKRLLVEAVIEYGDLFTTLEDDEFINLILRGGSLGGPMLVSSSRPVLAGSEHSPLGNEVISIRRSEIREYRASSLDLDQLTAKILQR